jgi:uncharacterized membrane protein
MPEDKSSITQDDKVFAALSYMWILCLVPLLIKRDREFVQYHARQGLVLFIAELILSVIGMIPVLGWLVGFFGWIAATILSVLGIVAALVGRYWEMPFLGSYAKKINL